MAKIGRFRSSEYLTPGYATDIDLTYSMINQVKQIPLDRSAVHEVMVGKLLGPAKPQGALDPGKD